jgi:DNA polymerase V
MSDPVHLVREEHWRSGLIICSANFPLYGDLSSRMMRTIAPLVPALTVYSIDKNKLHTVDAQSKWGIYGH